MTKNYSLVSDQTVYERLTTFVTLIASLLIGLILLIPTISSAATQLPKPLQDADFRDVNLKVAKLGQLLFYDKILSGNQNIACSTCHHHTLAGGDGLSLGIGEGGMGLGEERKVGSGKSRVKRRVPRNASSLFNLGAKEFTHLFHDGRVSIDPIFPSGFNTPAEEFLPKGLDSLLAAQALFPVTSAVEMAGERNENQIAGATRRRADYVWAILEKRLQNTTGYEDLFKSAFPQEVKKRTDINIVQVANALAAFIEHEWKADNSPFDSFLKGNKKALNADQKVGMDLFYGKAKCSSCHSGALQTDHNFYALMLPNFGPGRTRRFEHVARDRGRINETDRLEDSYRFRTPSLRNIEATAPYGHNGAYSSLKGIIRHHIKPIESLKTYDSKQLVMPNDAYLQKADFLIQQDQREMANFKKQRDIYLPELSKTEIESIISFLGALTDKQSLYGKFGAPNVVPSNIAVD